MGGRGATSSNIGYKSVTNMTREELIKDLVKNYDKFTRGDLQGTVEAYAMVHNLSFRDGDQILQEIDRKWEQTQKKLPITKISKAPEIDTDSELKRVSKAIRQNYKTGKFQTVYEGKGKTSLRKKVYEYRDKYNKYVIYRKRNGGLELTMSAKNGRVSNVKSGDLKEILTTVKDNWNKRIISKKGMLGSFKMKYPDVRKQNP